MILSFERFTANHRGDRHNVVLADAASLRAAC
jgi:hypothetical protein